MESMEEIGNPNKLVTSQGQADEMGQLSFMSNSIPRPKTKLFKEPSNFFSFSYFWKKKKTTITKNNKTKQNNIKVTVPKMIML